jgi:hypothetical protein
MRYEIMVWFGWTIFLLVFKKRGMCETVHLKI